MQAVILAGGLGTRLKGIVDSVPKPMAEFAGKPFLEYIIQQISKHFKEAIILTGYKGEIIKNYFGDGSKYKIKITYSEEKEPLGTGGALKNAEHLITEDFTLFNGDTYHELDYKKILENYKKTGMNTMILTGTINPTQVTIVKTNKNGIITELKERPGNPAPEDKYMNAGVLILKKEVLKILPEGKSSMELIMFPELVKQGMRTEVYNGFYVDIGTPPNYYKFKEKTENQQKSARERA